MTRHLVLRSTLHDHTFSSLKERVLVLRNTVYDDAPSSVTAILPLSLCLSLSRDLVLSLSRARSSMTAILPASTINQHIAVLVLQEAWVDKA
jgi:hypothetical protein